MSLFEFRQCTSPDCGLRFPIDPVEHRGTFCPRCGAPLEAVARTPERRSGQADSDAPVRQLSVLLDNIRSVYNVGAIFRTADGVGARHLYLCGITPTPDENPAIGKTALGAEKVLPWSYHPNSLHLVQNLCEAGHRLAALECTPQATPLHQWRPETSDKQSWVLMVGNEKAGVDPELLDLCEIIFALPMVGAKESLNVAVAFGAAAYWLSFR